ncbi:MAG: hypothetical protein E6H54_07715 [Betaproteobacteria bacterium]|nr:MAG: hypothetical protein E6H54_07715 [Betaproteobacteria bacterium]
MRKFVVPLALAASASAASIASAQQAAPAPSPVTGNMTLVSDYRFRGISQTLGYPAIQGGFDYAHASGLYLGNWNSNVSSAAGYPGGNLEMDFYGGYKKAFGDFGLDVGAIYYYYPGSESSFLTNPHTTATNSGKVHNFEGYIGGSWKWLSLKWFHAFSDYFMVPDTKGTNYVDLSANYDFGGGWGAVGHIGRLKVHNFSEANYTDYKLGVTKDLSGWIFGAALVATNAKGGSGEAYSFAKVNGSTYDAGKTTIVLSVGKTF